MYEIFGEVRSILNKQPHLLTFLELISVLDSLNTDFVREQLLPYCFDKLKNWPDKTRTLSVSPKNKDLLILYRGISINTYEDSKNKDFKDSRLGLITYLKIEVAKEAVYLNLLESPYFNDINEIDIHSLDNIPVRTFYNFISSFPNLTKMTLYPYRALNPCSEISEVALRLTPWQSTIKTLTLYGPVKYDKAEQLAHYRVFSNVTTLITSGTNLPNLHDTKLVPNLNHLILTDDNYDYLSEVLKQNAFPELNQVTFQDKDHKRYLKELNIEYQLRDPTLTVAYNRLKKLKLKSLV